MRIFHIQGSQVSEGKTLAQLKPADVGPDRYLWLAFSRQQFEHQLVHIQATLQSLCGTALVDLHVQDLLNAHIPSHYDYTSQYDLLVFRRLASTPVPPSAEGAGLVLNHAVGHSGPPVLNRIDTSPVGFAIFDRVLLTVHPSDCQVREAYAQKLLQSATSESRSTGARLPTSPADLMLRVVNHMVDGFLALRRELTHQLDHWQTELLNPKARFTNWPTLLDARLALHQLDEICEEQRSAIQDWIEAIKTWPDTQSAAESREREPLQVRSRDVLEHIERVVHHVRRLEQSAETAVQMHFSAQSHRTNEMMRTLTVLTAIFLPLNLIAGIFGMNFEFTPLVHIHSGFWWAIGTMLLTASGLSLFFWRKRYLARSERYFR